jgi:hypothetical protein
MLRNPVISHILVFAGIIVFPCTAMASVGERPPLDIETYSSPSAKWRMEIDPSNRDGCGKGSYRLTTDGNEVWHGDLPFTLRDAAVTDEGLTAGYAFSHGPSGFGKGGPGSLNMVIVDAGGKVRLNEVIKRKETMVLHGLPEPGAAGFIVHATEDRFIMRLRSDDQESWNLYQLSTGKKLRTIDPHSASKAGDAERYIIDAEPVTGLPFVLVHWWRYDSNKVGAMFSLLDLEGRGIWSLALPEDYTIAGDEAAEDRLRDEIRAEGAILENKEPGVFEIRFAAAADRVRFKVDRDPEVESGWRVREISRAKYQPPPAAEVKALDPPSALRLIESFVFSDAPPQGVVIRDIHEFDFDGDGHFGFLRLNRPEGESSFVLVDQEGRMIADALLPGTAKTETHCAWLAGSRWIITSSAFGTNGETRAWWFDADKRALTGIDGFECPSVGAVRGTGDGGFVALATQRQKYSSTDFLIRYDSLGKVVWKKRESDEGPSSMFSPEDVTVTSLREIAVLDVIRHTVQIFNLNGGYLRSIDLKKAWKRKPNYPSAITPDIDGGFIVHDFHGNPPYVRMKPDGSVRGQFLPKHQDGRVIDARQGVRAAPDGSLWASDGESFVKLSDQGVASRVVGPAPDNDKLGEIAAVAVDSKGNTFAVDRRTGAVHVFGPDGGKLHVCKPATDDFKEDLIDPHLVVGEDGGVMLEMAEENRGRAQYLCFGPDGKRQGVKSFGLDSVAEKWYLQPDTSNVLVLGYQAAFLVDPHGKLKVKIDRQADRRWFGHLRGAAFADDGSFVIQSVSKAPEENTITFFTPEGVAISTCTLETAVFATLGGYSGRLVAMTENGEGRLYDRKGKAVGKTSKSGENSDHFITRGGSEVWAVDRSTRKVERYESP